MDRVVEKMREAIIDYLLETNWDEVDSDDRICNFFKDCGKEIFSEEFLDKVAVDRATEEIGKSYAEYEKRRQTR